MFQSFTSFVPFSHPFCAFICPLLNSHNTVFFPHAGITHLDEYLILSPLTSWALMWHFQMHQRSWEVLTSVCTSNNICRQDKQQHRCKNSPTNSNNLILHHQYFIPELPLQHCLVSSAAWLTVVRWELTINDPHHLNRGSCNTWRRSVMNKRQSEIQCIIVLILIWAEGRSVVSFRVMTHLLVFTSG